MNHWSIRIDSNDWREPFLIDLTAETSTDALIKAIRALENDNSPIRCSATIKIVGSKEHDKA